MTRRTRKTIFYILLALFFVIGTLVVLYAEGWRIDLATFHVEKVGGVYIRAYPENASISIDGKAIPSQVNFLSHGTLVSDLYPKNYTVGLSLPGYDAWKETAEVAPSLVVEMKYAVLVPQTGTAVATTSDVANFFVIDGDHVDEHTNGLITWRNFAIGTGTIVSHSTDLKNMVYLDPQGNYKLYDFTTGTTLNITAILQKERVGTSSIESIVIDPYNDTAAFVVTPSELWTVNLAAPQIGVQSAAIVATSTRGMTFSAALGISQSFLAWSEFNPAANSSTIVIYDKFSGAVTDESYTPSGVTQGLTWIDPNTLGVLQNNGSLTLYNPSTQSSRALASDVKSFYPTTDGTLLAALEQNSLEIFDFGSNDYYRFNLPDMGSVQNVIWYKDESHLFVSYPDHVSFLDLADTSLINVTTVSGGTAASYDPQMNALYLVNAGDIEQFDFPN